ncbi:MAG: hypothetical protein QME51_08140 [Planctomycetota bacterium]|nr:hypothetical protein [Planctomycetota bacterium]
MSSSHIFFAGMQPATRYKDCGTGFIIRYSKWELARAYCCNKLRRIGNLWVQSYYDDTRFWCKKGTGCRKSEK